MFFIIRKYNGHQKGNLFKIDCVSEKKRDTGVLKKGGAGLIKKKVVKINDTDLI